MAVWFPASELLLVALLSWNVYCFPAKTGWSQHDPNEGSFSNLEASPGLYYSSSQSFPAQPSDVNHPAVSFLYEPENEVYSSPVTYPSSSPSVSTLASWSPAFDWDPVEESTTFYTVAQTPDFSPPPPLYQGGELANYENNYEHGNSELETEEFSSVPPPPPPPYPGSEYQGGELSNYASIFEHGNEERETEEQGFMPLASQGAELSSVPTSEGHTEPDSQDLAPLGPSWYYLFLTGQLPPGTLSHYQSEYEMGRDHWGEVHYEKYHYPVTQQETIPTQPKQLPSDELWQQPQYNVKA